MQWSLFFLVRMGAVDGNLTDFHLFTIGAKGCICDILVIDLDMILIVAEKVVGNVCIVPDFRKIDSEKILPDPFSLILVDLIALRS